MTARDHARLLVIEASLSQASVALLRGAEVQGSRSVNMGAGRADVLFPALMELLQGQGVRVQQLDGVVCGNGPGSFTSLRIAASLAKGLVHGGGLPLYEVSSLLLAAATLPDDAPPRVLLHADALRGERYVQWCERGGDGWRTATEPARRIPTETLAAMAAHDVLVAVGAGAAGVESRYLVHPSADGLRRVAPLSCGEPQDPVLWEPNYGRLAEAQVQWEQRRGHPLPVGGVLRT